jgi:hypothetical protein
MKAKHFDLVQNNFHYKQIVSVLARKFWDKAKQFDLVRQSRTFLFNPKQKEKRKNFRFGLLIIGTKAKHFDLVQKCSYRKPINSVLAQKFWYKAKQFDLVWKLSWAK